jgi:hypothetical protein
MGDMFGGFVSGEKGVDKIPAMLSDGEFVMSTGAVQKYGVDTLEGMNAAGGGTNKPKMMKWNHLCFYWWTNRSKFRCFKERFWS